MDEQTDKEVSKIRGRIHRNKYNSLVDGVSTFDTVEMFADMRTLLAACDSNTETIKALTEVAQAVKDWYEGHVHNGPAERTAMYKKAIAALKAVERNQQ
jgi:hypothetical protein